MIHLVAAALAWLLALASAASEEAPVCVASVEIEPAEPWVDQQALYRLRIESREDVRSVEWLVPPAFPGLRAERLPGRPEAGESQRGRTRYRVREEHRALFPERSGEIVLSEASLRCSAATEVLDLLVPATVFRARRLPAEGRPDAFSGLVGPLILSREVRPTGLRVGESARILVSLRGTGNLWDVPDPLPPSAQLGDVDLFRHRPELALDRGAALRITRRFHYDLVPRSAGAVVLPEIRIPYFDAETGRYTEAHAEASRLDVTGATPAAEPISSAETEGPERRRPREGLGAAAQIWLALRLALVAGLAAFLALRFRRRRRPSAAGPPPLQDTPGADELGDLSKALRQHLAARHPEAAELAPEEALALPSLSSRERSAAQTWVQLERARFDPEAQAPDREVVERALAALRGA